jgi:FAD-dependent halogenase
MRGFIDKCPPIRDLLLGANRVTEGPYGQLRVRKDYSYTHTHFWIPGLILVGDAACFIDPVFSSGVHLATYSALMAARSINTYLAGIVDEQRCFDEFESRYRREYSHFYDFLLGFYDMGNDLDSYYWHARKVMNSPEAGNKTFVDLVAGVAGSGERLYSSSEEYFNERDGLGDALFQNVEESNTPYGNSVNRRDGFYDKFLSELTKLQLLGLLKERRPNERPLFQGGLVPSRNGLFWMNAS